MKLYIHTYGRADNQKTWHRFPAALQAHTSFVVQAREQHLYSGYPRVIVLPAHIQTLSPTRQWICEYHHATHGMIDPKLCLLDDDLREFAVRRTDKPSLFTQATDQDVIDVFVLLSKALDKYAHAGILHREGADRVEPPYAYATRMMRVLAYDSRVLHSTGARFDRVPCKQDFDMTLQLLRAGYENCVITSYVQGQGAGSQAEGGCSSYRTQQMLTDTCHALAALHPGFVKVVQKTTNHAWGAAGTGQLVTRDEVSIQWKKAYKSSQDDILS